jgi:LysR family transcriptional regulator, nitrogen assimilation regulatory protein
MGTSLEAVSPSPSTGWMLTAPLVVRCREAFPGILLHMAEGFSGHVAEWLSTGRLDYAKETGLWAGHFYF